mgnify:CR=1 FL=1
MKTFIIAALTADGFIAETNDHAATWTSRADKQFFIERTKQAGVIIMGRKTYDTIGKPLSERLNVVYTHEAKPHDAENLIYTSLPPAELLKNLALKGYQEVAICGGASIYTLFLKAGLVDTLCLTIEPKLFGQGISLFTKKIAANLELREVKKLDEQVILLNYRVSKLKAEG